MMDIDEQETNSSAEQLFLSAVERGDAQAVKYALKRQNVLKTGALDASGRNAMLIALENGHIEILKLLLQYDVCVTDCLLYAVDMQFYKAVEVICNFSKILKERDIDIVNARPQGEDFHPVITPIILAAHHNDYDVIKLLLSYGASIGVQESATEVTEKHTLQHSLGSLLVYRALASEAYITLTSIDPINRAFVLCKKLRQLSEREMEFGDEFTELERQCETFAAELFAQTRSTEETTTILTYNPKEWATGAVNVDLPHKCFEAIVYKQKKFMAHPHCQQFLIERWYRGLKDWRETGILKKMVISSLIMMFFPILSLVYILLPHKKITQFFRIAYVKFVMHTGSSLMFLLLIFLSLFRIEDWLSSDTSLNSNEAYEQSIVQDSTRGGLPSTIEFIMLAWIIGMTWREMKQVWSDGLQKYLTDAWNLMDFLSLCFYWISYALMLISWLRWRREYNELDANDVSEFFRKKRMTLEELDDYSQNVSLPQIQEYIDSAVAQIIQNTTAINGEQLTQFMEALVTKLSGLMNTDTDDTLVASDTVSQILAKHIDDGIIMESRLEWDPYDPDLVVEGLFSLANILTVLRMINIVIISKQVGPLQISLWGMFNDIVKFLAIFCFVLLAFTIGLTQLYKFYSTLTIINCIDEEGACSGGFTSFISTLRTLFWNLFGLIVLEDLQTNANHVLTEGIGEFAFAAYHVIGIIILLNALIAMMSNTYTRIEENSDTEWKFARARLWLDYIQKGSTAPPPFNVIPSVKTIYRFLNHVKYWLCPRLRKKRNKKQKAAKAEFENNYEMISQQLVVRYWADKRSSAKEGEKHVTHSDILKVKQDISSFRYDMLTNHQRNEKTVIVMNDTTKEMMNRILEIQTTLDESLKALSRDQEMMNRVLEIQATLNALSMSHVQSPGEGDDNSTVDINIKETDDSEDVEHYSELENDQSKVEPEIPDIQIEAVIEPIPNSQSDPEIRREVGPSDVIESEVGPSNVVIESDTDLRAEPDQAVDSESDISNIQTEREEKRNSLPPSSKERTKPYAVTPGGQNEEPTERDKFGFPLWFSHDSSIKSRLHTNTSGPMKE
ncbi:short transient receptor potential channel 4-like isoform X2 [Glandiceps talaboti]